MSFIDLYGNNEHHHNLAHFAAMATLAASDGIIHPAERKLLDQFAYKLDITTDEYKEVMKKENKYPINPPLSSEKRLERLYDLFRIIFVDHDIDEGEMQLIQKYAIGLGFSPAAASKVIQRSLVIFRGQLDFDDYMYLIRH